VLKKFSSESNSVDKEANGTAIFFRAMLDKTLQFKATPCNGGKVSKERLKALACSNMSGSEKLLLLVLGYRKTLGASST